MGKHPTLASQRKDKDAALAAQNGIRVPSIFPTFDDARAFVMEGSGKMIARSEHPTELTGLSGINLSPSVELADVLKCEEKGGFWASFREYHELDFEYMCKHRQRKFLNTYGYCRFAKIDLDEYLEQIAYSFWKFIPGHNLYVMADPVADGRYRIFSTWKAKEGEDFLEANSYDLFEDGLPVTNGHTPNEVRDRFGEIVEMYEQVRSLFGSDTCWVVEMQLGDDDELYFLQRSAGPKVSTPNWSLANTPLKEWEFAIGPEHGYGEVIGSTPEEGIVTDVLIDGGTKLAWLKRDVPTSILSHHIQNPVIEQELIPTVLSYIETGVPDTAFGMEDPHSSIIPMVKANLYLSMPKWPDVISGDLKTEIDLMWDRKLKPNMPKRVGQFKTEGFYPEDYASNPDYKPRLKLNIRSDGREARVRVLEVC